MHCSLFTVLLLLLACTARAADWPMFLGDARHSGYASAAVQPPLTLKWTYNIGASVSASPIKAGDKVFIGTLDGYVYAFHAYTGALEWRFTAASGIIGAAAAANGKLYFNSIDGQFNCLDANTGGPLWQYTTSGQGLGAPTVADGRVFFGSGFPNNRVYALDAETGALLWQFYVGQPVNSAPAYLDGVVWAGAGDGVFYGLDADTGVKIAQVGTAGFIYVSAASILSDTVFAAAGEYDKNLYAFGIRDGAPKWTAAPAAADVMVKISSISSHNGRAFASMGYPNQKVIAFDAANGTALWQYDLGDASSRNFLPTPVAAGGVVYAASVGGTLYAYDAGTGATLAAVPVGGGMASTPAIADGMIVVATIDGMITAYRGDDAVPPTAEIAAPLNGATLGGEIAVTGTADDDNLESYTVEVGEGAAPATWTQVAKVYGSAVTGGALATWTPPAGVIAEYTIRLTAADVAGNSAQSVVTFDVDSTPPVFAGIQSAAAAGETTPRSSPGTPPPTTTAPSHTTSTWRTRPARKIWRPPPSRRPRKQVSPKPNSPTTSKSGSPSAPRIQSATKTPI